jgi:hypothetical protein
MTIMMRTVNTGVSNSVCTRKTMRTTSLTIADRPLLYTRKREIYSTHTLLLTPVLIGRRWPRTVSRRQQGQPPLEIESDVTTSLGRRSTFGPPHPTCSASAVSSGYGKTRVSRGRMTRRSVVLRRTPTIISCVAQGLHEEQL